MSLVNLPGKPEPGNHPERRALDMDQVERSLRNEIRALREELKARTVEIEDLKTRIET